MYDDTWKRNMLLNEGIRVEIKKKKEIENVENKKLFHFSFRTGN